MVIRTGLLARMLMHSIFDIFSAEGRLMLVHRVMHSIFDIPSDGGRLVLVHRVMHSIFDIPSDGGRLVLVSLSAGDRLVLVSSVVCVAGEGPLDIQRLFETTLVTYVLGRLLNIIFIIWTSRIADKALAFTTAARAVGIGVAASARARAVGIGVAASARARAVGIGVAASARARAVAPGICLFPITGLVTTTALPERATILLTGLRAAPAWIGGRLPRTRHAGHKEQPQPCCVLLGLETRGALLVQLGAQGHKLALDIDAQIDLALHFSNQGGPGVGVALGLLLGLLVQLPELLTGPVPFNCQRSDFG